jgi:type IV pilus assembly protein PilM
MKNFFTRSISKRLISIDFGRAFVKIAYIEPKGKNFELLDYEIKSFSSPGDASSEAVNFINDFIQKRSISEKGVYLTLSDPDLLVTRVLTLPILPAEEILGAAKWQLKEDLPFNIDEAIIDYRLIKEYQTEQGAKKNEIICFCAKREFIQNYLSVINKCNLSVERVSTPFNNYGNILELLRPDAEACAILDIGHAGAGVCVYRENKPYFLRTLAFSSQKITQSLTETLASDKGKIELTIEQAEDIKKTFGIPLDESGMLKDNIQAIHVISLMRPFLEGLVRELKLSFNYFSSNFKESQPQVLYITGGGASLKNLEGYLNKELNLKVEQLPLPDSVKAGAIVKEKLSSDKNQVISSLGAVMAGTKVVNLLPEEIKGKNITLVQNTFLRIFAVILGGLFLFSLFFSFLEAKVYKKRLGISNVHLQTIQQLKSMQGDIDELESLVNKLQQNKVPVCGLLKQISIITPTSIILSGLSLDQDKRIVTLRGKVQSAGGVEEAILTDLMKTIEGTPFFGESSLVFSQNESGVQTFEIKCNVTY